MDKKRVVVLGAGLVGNAIAADLHPHFDVTAVDMDQEALAELNSRHGVKTMAADLSDPEALRSAVTGAQIVVGALPGSMGYRMIEILAREGKDIVDISFFAEDPFGLDDIALKNNITVVTDCGVAPGMGNIILGYHNSAMRVENYECYVGGLPFTREWPWEYKAVFSPIDVIEEYTRPARYVQDGHLVVREALSDPQLLHFDGIGSLEAWNSDGLRTLTKTMKIPNMIEKTLRYPGSIEYLRVLRDSGFFSYEEIEVKGVPVRPIDLTAALLFPLWKLKPGEEDFTVMRIIIEGSGAGSLPGRLQSAGLTVEISSVPDKPPAGVNHNPGKPNQARYVWELSDRYDRESGTISMARTTGYTCTAAVHLLARGMFSRKGICPPEYLGEKEENFLFILKHLSDRGVGYRLTATSTTSTE